MKSLFVAVTLMVAGCASDRDNTPVSRGELVASIAPTAVPVANSFRHQLYSSAIDQDFVIDVALLDTAGTEPLPVVYVTDGNLHFPIIVNTARLLALGGELPPMIIVGIGYPERYQQEILALRTRELTPTFDNRYAQRQQGGPMALPEGVRPGGAEAFLNFIEQEVKPFIAEKYAVKADDATLVGDSLGGLFALYTLFNRTESFQRYLVGSPSLWWHQKTLFADLTDYLSTGEDADLQLFLSVGSLEEKPGNVADDFKMVSNMQSLEIALKDRDFSRLQLTSHIFEGETHLSVIPATFSRGLRALFADSLPSVNDAKN